MGFVSRESHPMAPERVCMKHHTAHNSRVAAYDHEILEIVCLKVQRIQKELYNGLYSKNISVWIEKCFRESMSMSKI